jgi:hypothetical protein
LQITHFRLQGGISARQHLIGGLLLDHLPIKLPDTQPAALTQPKWILDEGQQSHKGNGKQFHNADSLPEPLQRAKNEANNRLLT